VEALEADPPPPASISIPPPSEARATVLARPSYSEFAANITRSNSDAPTADGATNPLTPKAADEPVLAAEALAVTPRNTRTWLLAAIAITLLLLALVLVSMPD
jgi:hypothetical protein